MTFEPTLTSHRCLRCHGSGRQIDHASTGRALRRLRLESGHTLRSVARRMKMAFQSVSELELGRWNWNGRLIDRYLKACETTPPPLKSRTFEVVPRSRVCKPAVLKTISVNFKKRSVKETPTPC